MSLRCLGWKVVWCLDCLAEVCRLLTKSHAHAVDGERAHYLRLRFGKEWNYPHLYDLMISSGEDEEQTARVIEFAMTGRG